MPQTQVIRCCADETPRHSRLSPSGRRAIIDILRETKHDLPAYFG